MLGCALSDVAGADAGDLVELRLREMLGLLRAVAGAVPAS